MTGPSAIGSVKGTPNSIKVAPARASSTISSLVVSRPGSPAVMKGIKPQRPSRLSAAKVSAMRDIHFNGRWFRLPGTQIICPWQVDEKSEIGHRDAESQRKADQ